MQSGSDQTGVHARQVPQSIRFLRSLGVPATRLAGIFGETADNIRHIDSRSYKENSSAPEPIAIEADDLSLLRLAPNERQAQIKRNLHCIRLRTKQDFDQVEATVWEIYRDHQSIGFEDGYAALLAMRPSVANARHGQALRVLLLIEEKLAWFALAMGQTKDALDHAQSAMSRALDAFRESAGMKDYLLRYGEAALVVSICLQKMHQPERSFYFIQAADDANTAIGVLPGSEHLRQRGVALTQLGSAYDDFAAKQFKHAPDHMLRKDEVRHEVDLGMGGLRQSAFLKPATGFDESLELASQVKTAYGHGSMQYVIAVRSAAIVGLKFATPGSTEAAPNLLANVSPSPTSRVPDILSITPDLKLSPSDLDLWLRFAMSETPRP